jgi:hypothetical protein
LKRLRRSLARHERSHHLRELHKHILHHSFSLFILSRSFFSILFG